jgi:hypothetical protein
MQVFLAFGTVSSSKEAAVDKDYVVCVFVTFANLAQVNGQ